MHPQDHSDTQTRASRTPPWRRALAAWLLAALAPLLLLGGFAVGIDASGYFGLNRFGAYEGDELVLKRSMMRHYPHDALLLGDSRAAFTDVAEVPGRRFFNAAGGGAGLADVRALLLRHDLETVDLVVLLLPFSLGGCDDASTRLDSEWGWARHALSYEALARSFRHLSARLRGDLAGHRPDGTRLPDARVTVPFAWDGARDERYLERIEGQRGAPPLHEAVHLSEQCEAMLREMRRYARARDAEFIWVLAPLNDDLLRVTGTDSRHLRRQIEQEVTQKLGFALDYTAGRYSDPSNFGPRDALHFLPERGGALLRSAVEAVESRREPTGGLG